MLNFRNSMIFASVLTLVGCPAGDDSNDEGADTSSASDPSASSTMTTTSVTDTDSMTSAMTMTATTVDTEADTTEGEEVMCYGVGGPNPDGDPCTSNGDCMSGQCEIFTDVPLNEDAVCGPTPSMTETGCNTRITGTVFDFSTRMPLEGATMKVAAALNAITNPAGADALAMATSGADGRIDVTTEVPISAAIAIIALVEGPGAYLTATGLAEPAEGSAYAVGVGNLDLWSVPTASLDAWSAALTTDVDVAPELLPLGDAGGIVGLLRDSDGLPIAGATISAVEPGGESVVRYVAMDNSITADATSENGLFIIVGAVGTGEDFQATVDGAVVADGRAGTANNVVFTLIMTASE
jgi:hypothetical protein